MRQFGNHIKALCEVRNLNRSELFRLCGKGNPSSYSCLVEWEKQKELAKKYYVFILQYDLNHPAG